MSCGDRKGKGRPARKGKNDPPPARCLWHASPTGCLTGTRENPARPARSGRGHRPGHTPPVSPASPRPLGGRWPSAVRGPAGLQGTVAQGRRKRGSRLLFPPGEAKALPPLQWQGLSPLPQRHAGSCPAGGQSPRPAPAPPTAGAGLLFVPELPVCRHRRVRAGKRAAFPGPARRADGTFNASMAGAIAPATAPR